MKSAKNWRRNEQICAQNTKNEGYFDRYLITKEEQSEVKTIGLEGRKYRLRQTYHSNNDQNRRRGCGENHKILFLRVRPCTRRYHGTWGYRVQFEKIVFCDFLHNLCINFGHCWSARFVLTCISFPPSQLSSSRFVPLW